MTERILLVEDDETIRLTVGGFLQRLGYEVRLAADGAEALAALAADRFGLLLVDIRLPDMSGLEVLARAREIDEAALVVTMTAYPEVRTAVAALKSGAYDYINKPFDLEDLRELIQRALETRHLRHEVAWRRAQADACEIDGLVGESEPFREMVSITSRIAAAGRVAVLIRGESGTGKERVAQAIHSQSTRRSGPWVALNCSALPEGLLEAELFGHEKGAFTDARQMKRGLLELADGGTLFLDEIGDLALHLQPKLLRVLETQSFRRLGGEKEIRVDVRFVAATHRDLSAMVHDGLFREDLFYRLNVGAIDVPSLRDRREDIPMLARHFLALAAPEIGVPIPHLSDEVLPHLAAYTWPGNVRELRNVLERALILSGGEAIGRQQMPREIVGPTRGDAPVPNSEAGALASLAEVEAAHICRVLAYCQGNKTRAAEILGITRLTLRNKIGDAGVAAPDAPFNSPVSN